MVSQLSFHSREIPPTVKELDQLTSLDFPILGLIGSFFNQTEEKSFLMVKKSIFQQKRVIKKNVKLQSILSLKREMNKISFALRSDLRESSPLEKKIKELLQEIKTFESTLEDFERHSIDINKKILHLFFYTRNDQFKTLSELRLRSDITIILSVSYNISTFHGIRVNLGLVDVWLRDISKDLVNKQHSRDGLLLAKLISHPSIKSEHSKHFARKGYFEEAMELALSISVENYRLEALKGIKDCTSKKCCACIIL